jgi:hypothetical protein
MVMGLAAAYPEVFAGLAVGAGLEWKAAESVIGAYTAMSSGGPSPAKQGAGAYAQEGAQARVQKVLVIHGTSDSTVQSVNGKQVVSQYATTLDYVLGQGKSLGYLTDVPTATTKGQVTGGRVRQASPPIWACSPPSSWAHHRTRTPPHTHTTAHAHPRCRRIRCLSMRTRHRRAGRC